MHASPSRWLGDEPAVITRYHYDDAGRVSHTVQTTEAEWDEFNRAVVVAYLDYTAELHHCGRPLSESLRTQDRPSPDYVVGELECTACRRSDSYIAKHFKQGVPPATVLQVYTRAEAQAIHASQSAGR